MKAKKSLGQHFLTNQQVANAIVDAIEFRDCIVEVGPGHGVLTDLLVGRCEQLILIEKDDSLAERLHRKFAHTSLVTVVHGDFLQVAFEEILGDQEFTLVGNFPYNISSQIVFKMLDHKVQVPEMVGMFQLEMAQRILAGPGTKAYSVIGVQTQTSYDGTMIAVVPPSDFKPPPKVHSGVIRLQRKDRFDLPCDPVMFKRVVKAAFAQRRKMLRNSLKSLIPVEMMTDAALFQRRPEHVDLETFYTLTRLAEAYRNAQSK